MDLAVPKPDASSSFSSASSASSNNGHSEPHTSTLGRLSLSRQGDRSQSREGDRRGRTLSRRWLDADGEPRRAVSLSNIVKIVIDKMKGHRNFLHTAEEYPVIPATPPITPPLPEAAETAPSKAVVAEPALPAAKPLTAQEKSSTYKIAWHDNDFMTSDEVRPMRLGLEYTKVESVMQSRGIESTVVVFGSARIRPLAEIEARIEELGAMVAAGDDKAVAALETARKLLPLSRHYDEARLLGKLVAQHSDGFRLVVCTGGGPGIMEAANRGAYDAKCESIGLNITLPHEQHPNPYVTPELCFSHHYFAIRKMHFLLRAKALVACPGGFGTFDELFECLTLVQTGKMARIPIVLLGKDWWQSAVNFTFLADNGVIAPSDLKLFVMVDTAREAWEHICGFYAGEMENIRQNSGDAPLA
ncbi:hypothetical protein DFJ74DRAFT_465008 [Hyaloraphidium curvatum]|nr:hypothetical protein DFJ74DRAFT_465008 [Hyaloraphidium curvatum]